MQNIEKLSERFFEEHREFSEIRPEIELTCEKLLSCYQQGKKLLLCGNGGSCADADHIVGELMKGFLKKRPLPAVLKDKLFTLYGGAAEEMAETLQQGLPAIALHTHTALNSAFANDVDASLVYAQQVVGYGQEGDVLLAISTSGNASNVCSACMTAKAKGLYVIGLTGEDGGRLRHLCDCTIAVPAKETYRIQELHVCVYHFLCAYVEESLF